MVINHNLWLLKIMNNYNFSLQILIWVVFVKKT